MNPPSAPTCSNPWGSSVAGSASSEAAAAGRQEARRSQPSRRVWPCCARGCKAGSTGPQLLAGVRLFVEDFQGSSSAKACSALGAPPRHGARGATLTAADPDVKPPASELVKSPPGGGIASPALRQRGRRSTPLNQGDHRRARRQKGPSEAGAFLADDRRRAEFPRMILLTGATGYIGSHTWLALDAAGHRRRRHRRFLEQLARGAAPARRARRRRLALRSAPTSRDRAALERTCSTRWPIDAVVHFAASKAVGESVAEPLDYYANNVGGLIALARGDAGARLQDDRLQLERDASTASRERLPIREDAAARSDQPVRPRPS